MNKNSPTFCVMPHMGMAIQNDGDICVCNINAESFQFDNKLKTIDQMTIDEAWDSPTRKTIADKLDAGIKNPGCKNCWDAEAAGKSSARQQLNQLFGDLEPSATQPRILILKPGNTCNAACRMCYPETSSSWYKDAYELHKAKNPNTKFNDYIKKFETIKNSFNPDSPNMWPVLKQWYENLAFFDIYGGEPFLIPGLWQSLQYAIDNDYAKNIDLRISTNGSIYNEKLLTMLSQFKSTDIGVSIDSHNKTEFEYIRYKLNFEEVIDNCLKIQTFVKQYPNMTFRVNCTITVVNVWHIDEIYQNLNNIFKTKISVTNLVYAPDHYDIRHFPKQIKKMLIEKLQHNNAFLPILSFMDQVIPGCVLHWPKFCLETDKLDKLRGTQFRDVYPDWFKILEPYWDYKKPNPDWYGSCGFNA